MSYQSTTRFATRINAVKPSFIREILKVTSQDDVISFAGGLPNEDMFPVEALQQASETAFKEMGSQLLQYSSTEGDTDLREWIANRYQQQGVDVAVEDILITSGSQQALDLLAKVFINEGDGIIIENPGYLGALQAFRMYQPVFIPVTVDDQGMQPESLQSALTHKNAKLVYTVPNFQNPSGISYSEENRLAVAQQLEATDLYLIQDDPYGELRFSGKAKTSFKALLPEKTILLGSFSKTIAPSFRLGWVVAPSVIMKKLIIAKQAADLHTNSFSQAILARYLRDNSFDAHLQTLCAYYGKQKQLMEQAIKSYFPANIRMTNPEGGLFLWCALDEEVNTTKLFETAIKRKVAFVPGESFYSGDIQRNTMRLNFSCVSEVKLDEGIKQLALSLDEFSDIHE